MGVLGAIVGGSLGWMLGGPLGMILGGALGARMGTGQTAPAGPTGWAEDNGAPDAFTGTQQAQQVFVVSLIALAAKVAKADGLVTRDEVDVLDRFLRDELGLGTEDRRVAARIFNQARDSAVPASHFAAQIRRLFAPYPDRLRDLVALLLRIAHADGTFDPREEALIRSLAAELGLSEQDYRACLALFADTPAGPTAAYDILGVPPDADVDRIKAAYKRLVREYHPDVLQNKGLPDDFLEFAKQKLQRINAAYAEIRAARGF